MVKTALHFHGENSNRANTAFMVALFTILGALCFEYIGGYTPCELCLGQRMPYYIALPLLAIILGLWNRLSPTIRIPATLLTAAIFVWSTYLGGFHAGVEWGFWPGPTSCTGIISTGLSFDSLNDINASKVVPCDVVQWRFLGLSFAGYNTIISAFVATMLGWSALGQFNRLKTAKSQNKA